MSTGRGAVLRRLLWVALAVGAALLAVDAIAGRALQRSGVVRDIVDIQTPATLYAKLRDAAAFDGYTVALLGDSMVYGRAMEEHGVSDWRVQTLSAQLQRELSRRLARPVLVVNLGMNGLLPVDVLRLYALIRASGFDHVVTDISLRSFAADFAGASEQASRPWLADVRIDEVGHYVLAPGDDGIFGRIEARLHGALVNHSQLYRARDLLQWRYLDGGPSTPPAGWPGAGTPRCWTPGRAWTPISSGPCS